MVDASSTAEMITLFRVVALQMRDHFAIAAVVLLLGILAVGFARQIGRDCPYIELADMPNQAKRRRVVNRIIHLKKRRARWFWAAAVTVCFLLFLLVDFFAIITQ
jgi:hypothetical protein